VTQSVAKAASEPYYRVVTTQTEQIHDFFRASNHSKQTNLIAPQTPLVSSNSPRGGNIITLIIAGKVHIFPDKTIADSPPANVPSKLRGCALDKITPRSSFQLPRSDF